MNSFTVGNILFGDTPVGDTIALGAVWYIAFLFSTTCHEASHALVAKLGGDQTAFRSGQVTLNPIPHIRREPFGTVVVPILSYIMAGWMIGWASAPYDPIWQRRFPRRAAWMAFAGPGANFLLMLISGLAIRAGLSSGMFRPPAAISFTRITEAAAPGVWGFAATFLSILFVLNLLLCAFNLLPVPPLDGLNVITFFMGETTAIRFLDWVHSFSFGFAGLLLAWFLFDRIFPYVFRVALAILYPSLSYT
jgi:Zn-dependent protease